MIWLKRTAIWTISILLFLVVLLGFFFTPWGTTALISIANNAVDGLKIEHKSGGLLGTIELQRVEFNTETLQVDAKNIKANVDWSCSMLAQVCLSQLYLGEAKIEVADSEQPENQEPTEKITLPIAVVAPNIQLNKLSVDVQNVAQISWQSLVANLEMYQELNITSLELNQLNVVLSESQVDSQSTLANEQTTIDISQISQWQYQPIELPPLVIPIDLTADKILVTNAKVEQASQTIFAFKRLATQAQINDSNVKIEKFEFEHELVGIKADLSLSNDYVIGLSGEAQTTQSYAKSLKVNISAEGDLNALAFETQVTGDITAMAKGSATLDSPQLPLDIQISWQPLTLPTTEPLHLSSGNLSLKGNLQEYLLSLQTSLFATTIPKSQIAVSAKGNNQKIELSEAKVGTLGGNIQTTAVVTLTDVVTWQGQAKVEQIQPANFWPDLEGNINANLQHKGVYGADILQAQVENLSAKGDWLGYPLNANGAVKFDKKTGLDIPSLSVSNGDNKLIVKGRLDNQNGLISNVEFTGNALEQLYPDLSGSSGLTARISGTLSEPEVEYDLFAKQVEYNTISLQSLTSKGQVEWDQEKQFNVTTKLEQLVINQEPIENIQLELAGNALQHQLTTTVLSEAFQLNSTIGGRLEETKWVGNWLSGEFKSQWGSYTLNQKNTGILADWGNQHYQLDAHCWIDQQAKLCVDKANFQDQVADFDIYGSQLELLQIVSQFVPQLQDISTDTQFFFTAKGKWQADTLPIANIEGHFSPTTIKIKGLKKPLEMKKLAFDASVDGEKLITHFDFVTSNSGAIDLDLIISELDEKRSLQGELKIKEILAKPYQELIPQLTELSGSINGNLALSGDLKTPLFNGNLKLQNFNFAGEEIPGRISQWNQDLEFAGQSAKMQGEFIFGNGKGSSSGTFDWSDELVGDFSLTGDSFELEYRDIVRTRFSPNLKVEMTKTAVNVTGSADVFYARIKVKDLPPDAQSPSDDTIIVNQPVEPKTATRDLNMVFNVKIDPKKTDDVKLEAFGLKTDLRGALELKQKDQKLTGVGSLNLVNGTYKAYGQDLVIQKGNILFSGPLDNPRLDISAIRDESKTQDDVIAGIRVTGPAEQPSVEIFSEPTMIQSEALSYLLQGQSLNSGSQQSSDDQLLASVLLNAGLKGSENKVDQLGRKFGIEDLALGTNSSEDGTQVSLSGYIAPGVQLRYGVNVFDSSAEVALRYQILPKLFLEATSGVEQALDVYYQFSVGGKSPIEDEE